MKISPSMPDTAWAVGQKLYDATRDYQRLVVKLRTPRHRETEAELMATALAIVRRLHDACHTYEGFLERVQEA